MGLIVSKALQPNHVINTIGFSQRILSLKQVLVKSNCVSVCGLNGLFHASDFLIRQGIEVACAFTCGESAIVLQAEANKEVNLPVGHIHDLLDSSLRLIVAGQERQFTGEFRINGLIDEAEECLRLGRHIDIAVPSGRIIMNGHAAFFVERVLHQWHDLPGKRFQRGVIVGRVFQHGCRYGKHDAFGRKASSSKNVVDQEAMDTTISVLERVQKNDYNMAF